MKARVFQRGIVNGNRDSMPTHAPPVPTAFLACSNSPAQWARPGFSSRTEARKCVRSVQVVLHHPSRYRCESGEVPPPRCWQTSALKNRESADTLRSALSPLRSAGLWSKTPVFFTAIKTTLQISDDIFRCWKIGVARCAGPQEPRIALGSLAEYSRKLSLVHAFLTNTLTWCAIQACAGISSSHGVLPIPWTEPNHRCAPTDGQGSRQLRR